MSTAEKIILQLQKLPDALQEEVLHFIEFLLFRLRAWDGDQKEDQDFLDFSLASALRDMENEAVPNYTESDLKERWQ
ncbi:MAG: DUF2281 domain-containing protein [Calditrichaeota bacterium]|nr:MAG: DUF2281 domain-containing protein [Calditrichota bacterium]